MGVKCTDITAYRQATKCKHTEITGTDGTADRSIQYTRQKYKDSSITIVYRHIRHNHSSKQERIAYKGLPDGIRENRYRIRQEG